jgi:hypothetical protein
MRAAASPSPAPVPPLTPGRWLVAGGLALALFIVGMQSDAVFAALTRAWQALFDLVGLGAVAARLQQGTSGLVTTRSLPAMGTYSLLYVGGCLLLLHVLLRDGRRTRWAAQVYLGLLGLYVLLLVVGRLGGNVPLAYKLGRRIIDFTISPLPVMILLPVLWPGTRRLV